MSLVPLLLNLARELDTEAHSVIGDFGVLPENDFGFGILHPVDIFCPRMRHTPRALQHRRSYSPYARSSLFSPLNALKRSSCLLHDHGAVGKDDDTSSSSLPIAPLVGKDGFQVCLDVAQFKPNELNVKTLDNMIVIEGKHEEREDNHGLIQRHFVRKYLLPKGYDAKEVVSTVSSDGVLTVKAPPPPNKAIKQTERIVQIQQTGPAHMSIKAPAVLQQDSQQDKSDGEKTQNGGNNSGTTAK